MRKVDFRIIAVTAISLFSFTSLSAQAADYNWEGPYAGGTLGFTTLHVETADYWCWDACDAPTTSEQKLGYSAVIGYNWQLDDNFVVGVEADYNSGVDSELKIGYNTPGDGVKWTSEWENFLTLRGRAGLASNRTLFYVTGGVSMVKANFGTNEFGTDTDNANWEGTLKGLAYGVGVEHAMSGNLRFKVEYLYIGTESVSACFRQTTGDACSDTNPGENDDEVHWYSSAQLFRAGLNWKF